MVGMLQSESEMQIEVPLVLNGGCSAVFLGSFCQAVWAGKIRSKGLRGAVLVQPVGMSCERCYLNGLDAQGYETWAAFIRAYASDPEVKELTDAINKRMDSAGELLTVGSSQKVMGQCLEVHDGVVMFTESELKTISGRVRITKMMVDKVPCVSVPSSSDASVMESYYVFKGANDTDLGRKGILKTYIGVQMREHGVSEGTCMWTGQPGVQFKKLLGKEPLSSAPSVVKASKSVSQWKDEYALEKKSTSATLDLFDTGAEATLVGVMATRTDMPPPTTPTKGSPQVALAKKKKLTSSPDDFDPGAMAEVTDAASDAGSASSRIPGGDGASMCESFAFEEGSGCVRSAYVNHAPSNISSL
jgi:hypothetical protein